MSMKMQKAALAAATLAIVAISPASHADDATAQNLFEQGKSLYAQRGDLSKNEQALSVLAQAESQAQGAELKYDILILEARALYYKGTHTQGNDAKKTIHKSGQNKADAAAALSQSGAVDTYAEACYYAAINLGRWGEANGIISSAFAVPTLKNYIKCAIDNTTRDNQPGETVDGYGPDRVLGRMFKKLPGFLGGSHSDSVNYLTKAVHGAPTTALNIVYLADTEIKDGNSSEQADGHRILNDLLAKDPNTLNPDRVPETIEEFGLARDVLAGREIQ